MIKILLQAIRTISVLMSAYRESEKLLGLLLDIPVEDVPQEL